MDSDKQIRRRIFRDVKKLYSLRKANQRFIPAKTPVKYGGRVYNEEELINLVDSSLDFWLTSGRFAEQFEKNLSKFLGVKYCSLVNSGSSANLLAISALTSPKLGKRRLKPQDEVITTACGFPTTLNPILQNNLVPVFVDIESGTYNIDVSKIERAITAKTKAIFIAHTLGNPVDLDKIVKICKKYKLWLCEDNCDALGSKYQNRYTGSFGDISTCSFYPPHHITMGEGGAVLTNNPILHRIVNSFRDWGRDCWCAPGEDNSCGRRFSQRFGSLPLGYDHKYVFSHIGYNFKITDMQAAIGVVQLKKLPQFINSRKRNFKFLYSVLKNYQEYISLPLWDSKSSVSWFGFPIFVKEDAPFNRADFIAFLENNKISTRMLFGGNLTKQPAYRHVKLKISGNLKVSDEVMNNLFWIGVYPGLTLQHLKYIERIIRSFFAKYRKKAK